MTACDGCSADLPAYSVTYGMITAAAEGRRLVERIFCYSHGCRDRALTDTVNYPTTINGSARCTSCGVNLGVRDTATALLCTDYPSWSATQRFLAFCNAAGCAAKVLTQGAHT